MPPVLLDNGLHLEENKVTVLSLLEMSWTLPCAQTSDSSGKVLSLGPCYA